MDKTDTEKIEDLLNKLDIDNRVIAPLKNFVETYDGTNTNELYQLVLHIVEHLWEVEELKIDADSYNEIAKEKEKADKKLGEIKAEFKVLEELEENKTTPSLKPPAM